MAYAQDTSSNLAFRVYMKQQNGSRLGPYHICTADDDYAWILKRKIVWSTWLKSSVSSAKIQLLRHITKWQFILSWGFCTVARSGLVSMWCLFAVVKLRCSIFESCVTKEHCCFNMLLRSTWPQQNLYLLQESCKGNVQGNWLDCGEKTPSYSTS